MKLINTFAFTLLLSLSQHAYCYFGFNFQTDRVSYVCFRSPLAKIEVTPISQTLTLTGFDLMGIKSGSEFRCRGVNASMIGTWSQMNAQCTKGSDTINMLMSQTVGAMNVTLSNGLNVPFYSAMCLQKNR